MIGALALAAVLNGEAMRERAAASPLGPQRDLALAFWEPVAAVGRASGLTSPRDGLEALRSDGGRLVEAAAVEATLGYEAIESDLGLDGSDQGEAVVDLMPATTPTESGPVTADPFGLPPPTLHTDPAGPVATPPASETAPVAEPATATAAFAIRRATVDEPLRVLIVGDSTMDALGASLQRELATTGVTTTELDVRVSTGLARPDYFDWPARLRELTTLGRSEIVVIMVGANDAQPFIIDGDPEPFGTPLWLDTYRARVAGLLTDLVAEDRWVVWVAQPVMRNDGHDERMTQLNQIYAEEVARHRTTTLVDPRPLTVDDDGVYAAYLPDADGVRQLIRQDDGVHLTSAGGDRLAPLVIDAINAVSPLY